MSFQSRYFCIFDGMEWNEHINSDPNMLLGKPVIKGTRISVELILELFEAGWDTKMLLASYPNIKEGDLQAVFSYLRDCARNEFFFRIPKSA